MSDNNSKLWDASLRRGDLGESFVRWWASEYNVSFKRGTTDDNLKLGIDCYLDNIPTDVKNTPFIFLAKYSLDRNIFLTRHPFKNTTKCENYCILSINEKTNSFILKYNGSITDYLLDKYFKDETSLNDVKTLLNAYNGKSYKELGFSSPDQLMYQIKKAISNCLQPKIYFKYESESEIRKFKGSEMSCSIITYNEWDEYKKL